MFVGSCRSRIDISMTRAAREAKCKRVRLTVVVCCAFAALVCFLLEAVVLLDSQPAGRGYGRAYVSLASRLHRRCRGQDLAGMARQRGVNFSSVALKSFGGVRGLAATRHIRKGETVVSVPKQHLFTYTNTERSLRKLWNANPDVQELDRLVLTVMHEAGKPGGSDWDYYLCGMPSPESLGPPILWSRDRLSTYCNSSADYQWSAPERNHEKYFQFCKYVLQRTEYYQYIWREVTYPLISALPSVFGARGRQLQYADYAWALSAVLSRMWNMRDEDAVEFHKNGSHIGEDKWILAPFAELFNHQPGSGHIQWRNNDASTGVFEVVSNRNYRPGEQVYLSYGDYKCNLQLLLEYGFELENNTATCPEENATSLNNNKNNNHGVSGDAEDDDSDSDDEEEEKEKRRWLKPRDAVAGNRGRHGNRPGTNEDNRQLKDSRRHHGEKKRDTQSSLNSRPRERERERGGQRKEEEERKREEKERKREKEKQTERERQRQRGDEREDSREVGGGRGRERVRREGIDADRHR